MCDHLAYCERNELKAEIDRLRAELAKFDGMLPVPAEDANDLDDVVRELGIEDSFTTPADAVRELKAANAAKDARIAALEAAGNRLGDAAVDGVLTSIEAITELAEAKARIAELADLVTIHQHSCKLAIARAERAEVSNGTVADIPDAELLRRAVTNARSPYTRGNHWRWVAVKDVFLLGSTFSQQLCRRFDLDPDEFVWR